MKTKLTYPIPIDTKHFGRWCTSSACACMGCANSLFKGQKQWAQWIQANGGNMTSDHSADVSTIKFPGVIATFKMATIDPDAHTIIKATAKFFHISLIEARKLLLEERFIETDDVNEGSIKMKEIMGKLAYTDYIFWDPTMTSHTEEYKDKFQKLELSTLKIVTVPPKDIKALEPVNKEETELTSEVDLS